METIAIKEWDVQVEKTLPNMKVVREGRAGTFAMDVALAHHLLDLEPTSTVLRLTSTSK